MRLGFAALALTASGLAHADRLTSTDGAPLAERSHTVDIRLDRGVATYRVRREIRNLGDRPDEATLQIVPPADAVATGLRLLTPAGWRDAALLDSTSASDRYAHSARPAASRTAAILDAPEGTNLYVRIAPIAPGQTATFEYTLLAPTRYRDGNYELGYPGADPASLDLAQPAGGGDEPPPRPMVRPIVTVHAAGPLTLDERPIAADQPVTLGSSSLDLPEIGWPLLRPARAYELRHDVDAGIARITVAAHDMPAVGWRARYSAAVASPTTAFRRIDLDIARQLSPLPRRAQVVFVLDASYSVGPEGIATQLAAIRAYLSHVPDAEVELVVARRHATRVFHSFVPAARALAADPAVFALGNGSAIDEAADLAARALLDRRGPRRIVIFSDEAFRTSLTPDLALASLSGAAADTVVHLVELSPSAPSDDSSPLAVLDNNPLDPVATHHHGLHFSLSLPEAGPARAAAVLELVRPIRIDAPIIDGDTDARDADGRAILALAESQGVRVFTATDAAPPTITITGRLWSDPFSRSVPLDRALTSRTAALATIVPSPQAPLTPEALRSLARAGHAASHETSLLVEAPGDRPAFLVADAYATCHCISDSGVQSFSSNSTHHAQPDLASLIDPTACVAQTHAAATWHAVLDVEVTHTEIVDVLPRDPTPLTACLAEQVWQLHLPASFDQPRESFHLDLKAPKPRIR